MVGCFASGRTSISLSGFLLIMLQTINFLSTATKNVKIMNSIALGLSHPPKCKYFTQVESFWLYPETNCGT